MNPASPDLPSLPSAVLEKLYFATVMDLSNRGGGELVDGHSDAHQPDHRGPIEGL